MTGDFKLCGMVLPRLAIVAHGREFQHRLVLLFSCKSVFYANCQMAYFLSPLVFIAWLFCPYSERLCRLSELSLIPILHQSEQSACG